MKRKEEVPTTAPEPEPVPIPSQAALLNRFAKLHAQVRKLSDALALARDDMLRASQLLREHYGIIVSDSAHTTPVPTREIIMSSPVPSVQPPAPIEEEFAPVSDADNAMLKAARGQITATEASHIGDVEPAPTGSASISRPTTVSVSAPKKKGKEKLEGEEFAGNIAEKMQLAVRQGLGK